MNSFSLLPSERIIFALRSLYDRFGYSRYKMNKFEEYDLYARNKDFLSSEGVITFTDTNGKLMALKPDVTLSIVKNTKDQPGIVQKLYYNENVYRVSKGTHTFREIPQVGLEAIGQIDDYCIYEVLKLAAESLLCAERNCILEISHLGILEDVIRYAGIPEDRRREVLRLIGEKNGHELGMVCAALDIGEERIALLKQITSLYGTPKDVLPVLSSMLGGIADAQTLSHFTKIISALDEKLNNDMLRIDFSAVGDPRYYNGFVFKGFAQGLPASVLSGGQYDAMMRKMKRSANAIGFAVYLDILEQYSPAGAEYDVDTLLIYDDRGNIADIERYAKMLGKQGMSILVQRQIPEGVRYRQLVKLTESGVEILENNA